MKEKITMLPLIWSICDYIPIYKKKTVTGRREYGWDYLKQMKNLKEEFFFLKILSWYFHTYLLLSIDHFCQQLFSIFFSTAVFFTLYFYTLHLILFLNCYIIEQISYHFHQHNSLKLFLFHTKSFKVNFW